MKACTVIGRDHHGAQCRLKHADISIRIAHILAHTKERQVDDGIALGLWPVAMNSCTRKFFRIPVGEQLRKGKT